MKFLIVAISLSLVSQYVLLAGDYDLERITTTEGREYREILVVDSDTHGLLFRHERGIAKLPFASLPTNLRMLYEATVPLEAPDEATERVEEFSTQSDRGNQVPLLFTVRTRVYPRPACDWSRIGYGCAPPAWPSHWPRYHPAHRLVNPYCRELAVRDFLYTSGLLPKPPGVFTYRLPHNRPFLY